MSGRTVWKFPIVVNPMTAMYTNILWIPEGAILRHLAAQGGNIAMWFEIPDPEATKLKRGFQLFGTGNGPIGDHLIYVGTALLGDGRLVLHVYETDV